MVLCHFCGRELSPYQDKYRIKGHKNAPHPKCMVCENKEEIQELRKIVGSD